MWVEVIPIDDVNVLLGSVVVEGDFIKVRLVTWQVEGRMLIDARQFLASIEPFKNLVDAGVFPVFTDALMRTLGGSARAGSG